MGQAILGASSWSQRQEEEEERMVAHGWCGAPGHPGVVPLGVEGSSGWIPPISERVGQER